jgi:hypothetical protein
MIMRASFPRHRPSWSGKIKVPIQNYGNSPRRRKELQIDFEGKTPKTTAANL